MAENKIKVATPSGPADAIEVQVQETTERWSDVRLADGSELRIKPVIVSAARIDGQFDPNGNPLYHVKVNMVMVVNNAPDHLCRSGGDQPGGDR